MDAIKGIGKVVGAIPAGVGHAISGLPLVGGIGNDLEKVGNAFQGKGSFLGGLAQGGLPLAGMALGGLGLAGQGPLSGLGGIGSKLGGSLENTFAPGGNLDLGKLLGAGGQIAGLAGAGQQRQSAQNYANSLNTQRNQLMSQVLGGQNYGLPQGITPKSPNLNQQSSATPGIGSGGSVGY